MSETMPQIPHSLLAKREGCAKLRPKFKKWRADMSSPVYQAGMRVLEQRKNTGQV